MVLREKRDSIRIVVPDSAPRSSFARFFSCFQGSGEAED
jgi:hypothetical protein